MDERHTSRDNLELIDPTGRRIKIADIVNGDVIEEDDGAKWQSITLTIPVRNIKAGSRLQVVDTQSNKVISTFVAESISMFFKGEQFARIDGRHYIVFPKTGDPPD
jgi:hypothetical protein